MDGKVKASQDLVSKQIITIKNFPLIENAANKCKVQAQTINCDVHKYSISVDWSRDVDVIHIVLH